MHMFWRTTTLVLLLNAVTPLSRSLLIPQHDDRRGNSTKKPHSKSTTSHPASNRIDPDLTSDDATNFFSSDLGSPFDSSSSSDYGGGSVFDSFPNLPYFPDFGEIFRIQRTTTPEPPFRFPDYVRDVFSDRPSDSSGTQTFGGGVRKNTSRRPPRPASSGTRTKVQKQNHQGESKEKSKPTKSSKSTPVGKARDYPKIFRFTSDRVNLAEFDMKKKMNENYLTLAKGDDLDSDKVKRSKFLILHGGVFEIDRSGNGLFRSESNVEAVTASLEDDLYNFGSESKRDHKTEPHDLPYF